MTASGTPPFGGDEPKGIAVSRDGKHVYLVNGGIGGFVSDTEDKLDFNKFIMLGAAAASGAFAIGNGSQGLNGLIQGTSAQNLLLSNAFTRIILELQRLMRGGATFLAADSVTAVFSTTPPQPKPQEWVFPSDVVFGWNVNPDGDGTRVDQFKAREVFAERPFGMSIRSDGKRALVPFYQTGNFGVLDLDAQKKFEQSPPSRPRANALFAPLDDGMFQGVVAVTPALRFDNNLWPNRGSFTASRPPNQGGSTEFQLPSPDEMLMFPWDVQYSQNGRFAVATHAGVGRGPGTLFEPRVVSSCTGIDRDACGIVPVQALFPGFNEILSAKVAELGFKLNVDVRPGEGIAVPTGGGAVSIISDQAITDDFARHLPSNQTTTHPDGIERAYYSSMPLCKENIGGVAQPTCRQEVTTRLPGFTTLNDKRRFHRPRSVAIEPFIRIMGPTFGDVVEPFEPLTVAWREDGIRSIVYRVVDLSTLDGHGDPIEVNQDTAFLGTYDIDQKEWSPEIRTLFAAAQPPVDRHRYRVEVAVHYAMEFFSRSYVDFTYAAPRPAVVCNAFVTLRPNPRLLVYRLSGGREKLYYTIDLGGRDTLVGNAVTLRVADADGPVAVDIVSDGPPTPTPFGHLLTGSFSLGLRMPQGSQERFERETFDVVLSFETTACGQRDFKTAEVQVVPNNVAALEDLLDVQPPPPLSACTTTAGDVSSFPSMLGPKLLETLHFDPITCQGSPGSGGPFGDEFHCQNPPPPSDIVFPVALATGRRVLVTPLHSTATVAFETTTPKENDAAPGGNDNGVCEMGEVCLPGPHRFIYGVDSGSRVGPEPIFVFDPATRDYRISNESQLQGFWIQVDKTFYDDNISRGGSCPQVGGSSQASFEAVIAVQVQCVQGETNCPTGNVVDRRR